MHFSLLKVAKCLKIPQNMALKMTPILNAGYLCVL